jgi:hypothetical protein
MATGTRFQTSYTASPDSSFGSEALADMQVADLAMQPQLDTLTTIGTTTGAFSATFPLTASTLVNGHVIASLSSALVLTTPTAAAILTSLVNAQVGSAFDFWINSIGSAIIMTGTGTGITLFGPTSSSIAAATIGAPGAGKNLQFRGVVTTATAGSEAVSLFQMLQVAA